VAASAVPSQAGALAKSVLVRSIDLSDVVRTVAASLRAVSADFRIVMKLDVEGSEYTVLPRLVLTRALCDVSILMAEWHDRYFASNLANRVAVSANMSAVASGRQAVLNFVLSLQNDGTLLNATTQACGGQGAGGTRIVPMDDESFLWDHKPWPARDSLCGRRTPREGSGLSRRSADSAMWHELPLHLAERWMWLHDGFEDKGLLWILVIATAAVAFLVGAAVASSWGCVADYGWFTCAGSESSVRRSRASAQPRQGRLQPRLLVKAAPFSPS